MVVNVNEARRKHEAFGVDDLFILFRLELADFHDAVARNANAYPP